MSTLSSWNGSCLWLPEMKSGGSSERERRPLFSREGVIWLDEHEEVGKSVVEQAGRILMR